MMFQCISLVTSKLRCHAVHTTCLPAEAKYKAGVLNWWVAESVFGGLSSCYQGTFLSVFTYCKSMKTPKIASFLFWPALQSIKKTVNNSL